MKIYIGFDPRETAAFAVARQSVKRWGLRQWPVYGLVLDEMKQRGLYLRPTTKKVTSDGHTVLWDMISEAAMSTEHANARFLVPHLAGTGWALFMDGDMMIRRNMTEIKLESRYAVYCVKHNHVPHNTQKMDGQTQAAYARKNWSSFMIFNCDHPSNKHLTVEMVNSRPGRDLHRFFWLDDDEIGELPVDWNWLVGHSDPSVDPANVHFTDGVPDMAGYENVPYADEWRERLLEWAR